MTCPLRALSLVIGLILSSGSVSLLEGGVRDYAPVPEYGVPMEFWTEHSYHPVSYLKAFPVPDPTVDLAPEARAALVKLFRAAHYACLFKYRQSYLLGTDTPIYRLLKQQHPAVGQAESERGHVVLLTEVVRQLEELNPELATMKPAEAPPNRAMNLSKPERACRASRVRFIKSDSAGCGQGWTDLFRP